MLLIFILVTPEPGDAFFPVSTLDELLVIPIRYTTRFCMDEFYCNNNGLDDASVVELVTALGRLVNLKYMNFGLAFNNSGGSAWCAALANLLENPTTSKLEDLALGHNHICDTELAILPNGLVHNNSKVKKLLLEGNHSITATG